MSRRRRGSGGPHGVLIVDKPAGMTSHDVVQRVRRILQQRRVGHAGTLDPMATGVLVVMVGEATKLAPYLTAADKSYRARVRFGLSTDTLDAEGEVTEEAPLPSWWSREARGRLAEVLEAERDRPSQTPPIYSAIKVAGRRAHARARAGEQVDLAPRDVRVSSLTLRDLGGADAEIELTVGKGYYVRSLARDVGVALGVPSHLLTLDRIASGAFTRPRARSLEPAETLADAMLSMEQAVRLAMPTADLTEEGATRARHGGPMRAEHFVAPPAAGVAAWLHDGVLVAVGEGSEDRLAVLRGFSTADPRADQP